MACTDMHCHSALMTRRNHVERIYHSFINLHVHALIAGVASSLHCLEGRFGMEISTETRNIVLTPFIFHKDNTATNEYVCKKDSSSRQPQRVSFKIKKTAQHHSFIRSRLKTNEMTTLFLYDMRTLVSLARF